MYLEFFRGLGIGMQRNGTKAECPGSSYYKIDNQLKFEHEIYQISHVI
jgi:hypothetical protein